jgi:CYTH domain-containing protein
MTGQMGVPREEPIHEGKYARIERERRFLIAGPPIGDGAAPRRITDRYISGTRLRLRHVEHLYSRASEFKLAQKVPAGRPGHVQGLITNIYVSSAEHDLLATLPCCLLSKIRLSIPPLSIDIFDPPLHGLVIGEAEFGTDAAAQSFTPPPAVTAEITDDKRFTGGRLARASRDEVVSWLGEYGIKLAQTD